MNKASNKATNLKHTLMHEIETGVYRQSEKLPSERDLSTNHKISRTTVRQAMNELEEAGIVIRRPPVGVFVAQNALKVIIQQQESQVSLSVAFVIPDKMINNPLIQLIFATCRQYMNKTIKLFVVLESLKASMLDDIKADVMILYSYADNEELNKIKKHVGTLILLNRAVAGFDYITVDNFGGGKIMAEHLMNAGHRIIGCIGPSGNDSLSDFDQRLMGIKKTCEQNGIKLVDYKLTTSDYTDLTPACHWAIDNLWHHQPDITAIIGLFDEVALSIICSLQLRGIIIPEDVSVMGFDNHFYSQYMKFPLSTVKYPAESIGVKIAAFIESISKGEKTNMQESIMPLLIDRHSIKKL